MARGRVPGRCRRSSQSAAQQMRSTGNDNGRATVRPGCMEGAVRWGGTALHAALFDLPVSSHAYRFKRFAPAAYTTVCGPFLPSGVGVFSLTTVPTPRRVPARSMHFGATGMAAFDG